MNKDNEQREMSRTLKFRVWNGTEMAYDVTVGRFGVFYVNPTNNGLDPKDSASITPFTTKYHEGTPVMQFTGLLDKNGKEIYEGDIVKGRHNDSKPLTVMFDSQSAAFKLSQEGYYMGFLGDRITKNEIEVIGHIYSSEPIVK